MFQDKYVFSQRAAFLNITLFNDSVSIVQHDMKLKRSAYEVLLT